MTTFEDFALDIFPDLDPREIGRVRNPSAPEDLEEILDYVACNTGVPKEWLAKSAQLVLEGLAGCQCLWFLHGASGEIEDARHKSLDTIEDLMEVGLTPAMVAEFVSIVQDADARSLEKLHKRHPEADFHRSVRWGDGLMIERSFIGRDERKREVKLGKWLRKQGASTDLLHAFETRDMPVWHWKISAHPFDVLTMSHNRPWTSCMRPGGAAEFGPLTDMAAGSAVMFFYRPGADKPCGRRMLRPLATGSGYFSVLDGGETYGCGPRGPVDITHLIPEDLGSFMADEPFCVLGKNGQFTQGKGGGRTVRITGVGLALTRGISSDVDQTTCGQTDEQYDAAYLMLIRSNWPASAIDLWDLRDRAEGLLELIEEGHISLMVDVTRDIAESWVERRQGGIEGLRKLIQDTEYLDVPTAADYKYAKEHGVSNDLDLPRMVEDRFKELLEERLLSIPTDAILIRFDEPDNRLETVATHAIRSHFEDWGTVYTTIPRNVTYSTMLDATEILDVKALSEFGSDLYLAILYPSDYGTTDLQDDLLDLGFEITTARIPAGLVDWDPDRFLPRT